MFDYKYAYTKVYGMFRQKYYNLFGTFPSEDLLYKLADNAAGEASRGISFDMEEIEEIIKDKIKGW